jgi:hypothetical protein
MAYKTEARTVKLSDALDTAFGEFESLADEFGDWRDNMSDSLSATDKYDRVNTAADTLGEHTDAPDIPKNTEHDLGELDITYFESVNKNKKAGPSRQVRLDNACSIVSSVIDKLDDIIDDEAEHPLKEEAETLRDSLQETIDNVESVDIPTMFG